MMMSVITLSPFNTRSSLNSSTTTTRRNNNNSKFSSTSSKEMNNSSPLINSTSLGTAKGIGILSSNGINKLNLRASSDSYTTSTNTNMNTNTRASVELLSNGNSKSKDFMELLTRIREGLRYHDPELCEEGVNGTYFLKDKNGNNIGVFKPQDEEVTSENNPKRNNVNIASASGLGLGGKYNTGKSMTSTNSLPNKGILPGEGALREVAAYLLDHEAFYGVPKTQLVRISHPTFGRNINSSSNNNSNANCNSNMITKIGSLQEFIENDGSCEDFGPKSFPINEVHKIGILDIQILNADRHAGNILIKKVNHKPSRNVSSNPSIQSMQNSTITSLVPIDQGFSLPDTFEGITWFEWMNWPQAKYSFDDEVKSYIQRIDVDRDIELLQRELGIRPECLNLMKITTILLKKAAELNLTLYDVGLMICRKQFSLSTSIMIPPIPTIGTGIDNNATFTNNNNNMNGNRAENLNMTSPSLLELIIEKTKKLAEKNALSNTYSTDSDNGNDSDHDYFMEALPSVIEQEIKARFSSSSPECKYYSPSTSKRI